MILQSLSYQKISTMVERRDKAMYEHVAHPPPTGVEQWSQEDRDQVEFQNVSLESRWAEKDSKYGS